MKCISNNILNKKYSNNIKKPLPLPTVIKKKKILCYSDYLFATLGFGVVSKHILSGLYNTGKYEIDQLAINYFIDPNIKSPINIIPARFDNPNDPYGKETFIRLLRQKTYDAVLIINDTFVVEELITRYKLDELKLNKEFKLVYYYPIDCHALNSCVSMIKLADRSVAYTQFAYDETLKVVNTNPTDVIYHGTNIKSYYPLTKDKRKELRLKYFKIKDDDTFLFISINRNSLRKNIAQTIYAFNEFKKEVPNSLLYLHCQPVDGQANYMLDLKIAMDELGLSIEKDVIFPVNYNTVNGFPEHILNEIVNCGNCCMTTNLGEGFGLFWNIASAAGIPMLVPDNTVHKELIIDRYAGYSYPCKEPLFIENSGYRFMGRIEDIVNSMLEVYQDWKIKGLNREIIINNGLDYAKEFTWDNVNKQWVKLFDDILTIDNNAPIINKDIPIIQGEVL